ncbi:MAG: WD40 repeat domain-containing protein [Planctomycetaceae bacterium]|nr:WD40 repeat domain-containing protein [Planctomycetaceae bacterium]
MPTRSLWSPPGRPLAITYSPDGELVLAGGVVGHSHQREPIDRKDQGWATLWDSRTEQTIRLEGHTGPVTAAAFSPDGTRCATGSHDKTIRLWDTSTGRCLCVFRGYLGTIHDIAYSPHGERLLSAAEDGAAFWNVAAFVASPTKSSPLAGEFNTVEAFKTIYDGSSMSNPTPGTVIPRPPGYEPASFDFRRVTWPVVEVGEVDRKRLPPDIQRWLAQSTARESSAPLPPSDETPEYARPFRSCGTSRDGRREVFVSRGEKEVVLRDDGGQVLRTWDAGRQYSQAAISPSGKEVAIARDVRTGESQRYEITIYDADTGTAKRVIREDDGRWSGHFRIDPQEKTIMLRMAGSKVVMRDYQTGEHLAELGTHEGGAPRHAEYSPDGRFLISGKYPDPVVATYNATTLDPVATFPNLFPAWSFSLSPDETRLLVGQRFGRSLELVTMWDVQTARRLWNRVAPRSGSIEFSPDGQRFLAYGKGSLSEFSVFWDAEAGEILCTVLTSSGDRNNRPVLGIDGLSLHLGTAEGPRLWPRDDSPVRSR